ncbi:MAG: serine hydrolase [Proteobacteria bacterium]|nr:serine hydrolase [Pseudomonadota bacterium]
MPGEEGSGYGFGWAVASDGTYSHGGSDGTWAWVEPSRGVVGIVFTQSRGGKIPSRQFRRVVNASIYDD